MLQMDRNMNVSGMMIQSFLVKDEGKTLEFKENCRPLRRIVRSVFDELPCPQINSKDINFRALSRVRGLDMNAGGIH